MSSTSINQLSILTQFVEARQNEEHLFCVLIDPEHILPDAVSTFVKTIPSFTTHLFVGGSTADHQQTRLAVKALKQCTSLPVILFPGSYKQITDGADALLFLSLLSGRNPEYLISQQVKAVPQLKRLQIEIIPVAYLLIDGGRHSSVEQKSQTRAMCTTDVEAIVNTALAGQYSGKKMVYLEAGSGAVNPVPLPIVTAVHKACTFPIIVGGGIKNTRETLNYYKAGATMVVVGTAFEKGIYSE